MALKLNIQPAIEKEMEELLEDSPCRSKTEYINKAIAEYNHRLKRLCEVERLRGYFQSYQEEGREILNEFAKIRNEPD